MIECYYQWCKYHPKTEPFCSEFECKATKEELEKFAKLRKKELKKSIK